MGFFSGLLKAAPIISAGAELLGGATSALGASQQLSARDAMDAQAQFNFAQHKKSLLEGPSLEMAGLKRAGINPFYRYGQHGTPLFSAQGVSQAPSINRLEALGSAIGSSANSALDALTKTTSAAETIQRTENLVSELDKIVAETKRIASDTSRNYAQRDLLIQQRSLTFAQEVKTWLDQDAVRKQMELTDAQIASVFTNITATEAQTLLTGMSTLKTSIEAKLLAAGVPQAELDSRIAETFPYEVGELIRKILLGN